ncbi:MAG: hypothetical protein HY875_13325 [Chloroflexi bacterium]|nr:hypothetical protein [Chloroflexota bacterium]
MTAAGMPMPTPIPPRDDFPVTWESPEEAMLQWSWDQQHLPLPVSPLAFDIAGTAIFRQLAAGLRKMGAPIAHVRTRRINTFLYAAMVPDFSLMEGVEERMQASVKERGFTMYRTWETEFLPEVEEANARLIDADYARASNAELAALVDWAVEKMDRVWELHFDLFPGFQLAGILKQTCERLFGMQGLDAYELMQGEWNLSVESGSKLWQLAQGASPEVKQVIAGHPANDALRMLGATDGGREFLAGLGGYLRVYGWRSGSFDLYDPSWVENPAAAIDNVRLMLKVATDPADDQRKGAERAAALADGLRARLAGDPAALAEFEAVLAAARDYPRLLENHNFHIDQKYLAAARLPFAEIGRRMAAQGLLVDATDFPYLALAEVRQFLGGDRSDRRAVAAERKAEVARWQNVIPPRDLGSMPPQGAEDPFRRDFGGFEVEASRDPKVVNGNPGARGVATGRARVIRTLADSERLEDGDILVCDTTTPAWTPLFASIGGIVADSGGALSHGAVVAREYGIPAVMGTRVGTQLIPDGALITIDGAAGVVRIDG